MRTLVLVAFLAALSIHVPAQTVNKRTVLSLNGTWDIAQGNRSAIPIADSFAYKVPVPGLVSLAQPAFTDVAPAPTDRESFAQSDSLREAFWYRRKFTIDRLDFDTAILKIAKATYTTRVFVNGKDVGENIPCFAPGFFNLKKVLRKGENEIMVRIGASRDAVPAEYPDGFDSEKKHYMPGIYDDVSIILTGSSFIRTLQTVPDILHRRVGVEVNIINRGPKKNILLTYTVREARSNKVVGTLQRQEEVAGDYKAFAYIPIADMHLWSPEDPFLYTLEVSTDNDNLGTRFGMRKFYFDPNTQVGQLNGNPYYMRGTNITILRFFEDSSCRQLPWTREWVRGLFESFKQFHWNSVRFCIGAPPQQWYDIADEVGILIQNEYPNWFADFPASNWPFRVDLLAKETTLWMEEGWNHPSVVIWDMSNETADWTNDNILGQTVARIKPLDLSQRPWDNSFTRVRSSNEVLESHPYHFVNPNFTLKDLATADSVPPVHPLIANHELSPVIINEYGWLWLNRDGTPATLTKEVYKNLLGDDATPAQRRHLYYTYLAAETEFWRCHRKVAGVLSFCALSYSRPDGQTSDFFINPTTLEYDPECLKYLPDAFSPVGLMLKEWGTAIKAGGNHDFSIYTINDLGKKWEGTIRLQILKDNRVVAERVIKHSIPAYGRSNAVISCSAPKEPGSYSLVASLQSGNSRPVKSIRENIPFK